MNDFCVYATEQGWKIDFCYTRKENKIKYNASLHWGVGLTNPDILFLCCC